MKKGKKVAKAKILKTIDKLIEKKAREVREGGRPAGLLKLIVSDIRKLKEEGYDYKTINEIINNSFDVNIRYNTFLRWVKRNIDDVKKSNIEEEKAVAKAPSAIKSKKITPGADKSKSNKEVKNETAEVNKKKKVNPAEILNSDIFATDDEYKNLL